MKLESLLCNSDFRKYAIWQNLPAQTSFLLAATVRAMTEVQKCTGAPWSRKLRRLHLYQQNYTSISKYNILCRK